MKIILIGSSGAMGQVVAKLAKELNHQVVAGLQNNQVPQDFPYAADFESLSRILEGEGIKADVIIDFSTPALTNDMLEFAEKHNLAIMLATTGHNEEQSNNIKEASHSIPILDTHNTSIGVNVMQEIVEKLTEILYPLGYDIEIMEKHHRYKKDSPSGTALMLLDSVQSGMKEESLNRFGRHGDKEERVHNEIGIHAIRSGDIVGEHTVLYGNNQETIEITHRAGSKELFARGAIAGAQFLVNNQEPGLYNMSDVWK